MSPYVDLHSYVCCFKNLIFESWLGDIYRWSGSILNSNWPRYSREIIGLSRPYVRINSISKSLHLGHNLDCENHMGVHMRGALMSWHNMKLFAMPFSIKFYLFAACPPWWRRVKFCEYQPFLWPPSWHIVELSRPRTSWSRCSKSHCWPWSGYDGAGEILTRSQDMFCRHLLLWRAHGYSSHFWLASVIAIIIKALHFSSMISFWTTFSALAYCFSTEGDWSPVDGVSREFPLAFAYSRVPDLGLRYLSVMEERCKWVA